MLEIDTREMEKIKFEKSVLECLNVFGNNPSFLKLSLRPIPTFDILLIFMLFLLFLLGLLSDEYLSTLILIPVIDFVVEAAANDADLAA